MLTDNLRPDDKVAIVVYAGAAGVVLPATPGSDKQKIKEALQKLEAGGSTAGGEGIKLAYKIAGENLVEGGNNRVILATDGDFNVGASSDAEMVRLNEKERESGVFLTVLGFGMGNYKDNKMQQLADKGNGNHAYIDRLSEANKVLGEELSATLLTIAKDVKIQVEFNPVTVSEYRLIGYENRALNEEDFANDRVDAGEIGAGHRVTALYEISLVGDATRLPTRRYAEGHGLREETPVLETELAHLRIRYKQPDAEVSTLIETPILREQVLANANAASDDFRFAAAVAAFGQSLRGGEYLEGWDYQDIAALAGQARGADAFGYRGEFLQLVHLAASLDTAAGIAQAQPGD
jgi:Ca-activated chloride channel family protein